MHDQALLDLYRLATGLSTWILHNAITSKKNYCGTIKCHDTIKSIVHKLSGASEKQIALSLLTNHFPLQN